MIWQQLLNGLITGFVYALFTMGFTLVFSVQKVLNLAHGGVFMAGAFIAYYSVALGLPFWLAALLAMLVAGILSVVVDMLAFNRLRAQLTQANAEFAAIVASIGANLIIVSVGQQVSQTQVLRFPFGSFPIRFFEFAGLRISLLQITMAAVACILLGLLMLYLYRTNFGREVRAVAINERAASLLGVNPRVIYGQTFMIAGALAGIAGVFIGLSFNSINFMMGERYMLYAFVVVVLGGMGSLPGSVIASLMLGLVQTMAVAYLPPGLSDAVIFSLLFVALLVRPAGLFGNPVDARGVGRA